MLSPFFVNVLGEKGMATKNPVAKNMEAFNRPVTHVDKKKEQKRGKRNSKKIQPKDVI